MTVRTAHGDRQLIWKRGRDEDPVKQPRERVADTFARDRSARATCGDRIGRNAERFDEVLLAHHRCFTGHGCVATGAWVLQRIDEDAPSFAEAQQIISGENVYALRG